MIFLSPQTSVSWQITGFPVKGHLPVIRCLPTLGTSINGGVTAYTKGRYCNEDDVDPFLSVFKLVSHCEEVEEKYMNIFAAFGSGVAFVSCYNLVLNWLTINCRCFGEFLP